MPRPVWIMLALLIAAVLACSVEFSTAHFENAGLYRDPGGETRTRSFKPDEPIYCIVDLKDADDERHGVRLILERIVQNDDGTQERIEVLRQERLSGNATLSTTLFPVLDRWERGSYQIVLYLDGDKKETLDFNVK